jgi:hypothetical protein
MEKINRLIFLFLLAAIVWTAGCATQKPDPLAGWYSTNNLSSNKVIADDYQDYIQKLSLRKREFVLSINFFEDRTGQHAVNIATGENGRYWKHILIYDKNNKRIKVIQYKTGWYRS